MSEREKKDPDGWLTGLYRTGVLAGVGALLWFNTHFTPAEKFEAYRESHREWDEQVVKRLEGSIADTRSGLSRIETKLDVLLREHKQVMAVHKQMLEERYQ